MRFWIAVNARLADDPEVRTMAKELYPRLSARLSVSATCGLLVTLWGKIIDEQEDGNVAGRDDDVLEEWARWDGKRGLMAKAFLARFVDSTGKIVEWDDYQGPLIRRRERDRLRKSGGKPPESGYFPPETSKRSTGNKNRNRNKAVLSAPNGAEREQQAPDNAPAPEGARDAVAGTGNYLDSPSAREALHRRGVRDEQIDKAPTGTLATLSAEDEFWRVRYDAELEAGFVAFKTRYPQAILDIGADCRRDLGLPDQESRAELSNMQLLRLRSAVIEVIRQRCDWPTVNTWNGNQFPPIPEEP